MGERIKVKTPIVEIDGDEMTRIIWRMIKDQLLLPYLDMNTKYYDLGIKNRDETNDSVTVDSANAIKEYRVGVKCATITPNADRVKEYGLKKQWESPNGTIRRILDGTVFRVPILVKNVKPAVRNWEKPIHIGRHAYGDLYQNREIRVSEPGIGELVFTSHCGGRSIREIICEFNEPGVLQGVYNTDRSIRNFARACFTYALDQNIDCWFSAKDTISKTYDALFRNIFREEYEENWKHKFEKAGIGYFFTLIDTAVARIIQSEGGMLWACKNYDGDVMSDMLASAYGSLAMMSSVLVSPSGCFQYEAAHGTVQDHYYMYIKGERTSTNSTATMFAWAECLKKRAELDATPEVSDFAQKLEVATIETIESGIMTGDLIAVAEPNPENRQVYTEDFISYVKQNLEKKLAK